MKILKRIKGNKKWRKVDQKSYSNEAELQDLLYEDPSIVPVQEISEDRKEIKVAIKEFGLPGAGSSDIVGIDEDGNITIIETKLAVNSEIKRRVIGQILEYAAFLWKKTYEQFDEMVQGRENTPLLDLMSDLVEGEGWSEEEFRREVSNNLQTGDFSLFIIVDKIDDDLRRILEFINSSSFSGPQIYAFAARYYVDKSGDELLVPQLYGASIKESEVRESKGRKPPLTYEELRNIATENEVGDLYDKLTDELDSFFDYTDRTRSSITFIGLMEDGESRRTIFSLLPKESSSEKGLNYQVYTDRFAEYFDIKKSEAYNLLPFYKERKGDYDSDWAGERGRGYFKTEAQVEKLLTELKRLRKGE